MENVRLYADIKSFRYPDGTEAIKDLNLKLRNGEFVGILGSNGSGKTTLLKIMAGLLKDFEGEVLLDGVSIKRLSPKEIYRKVGLVFQNPDDQLFAPTVFEDVAFGPVNMGFCEAEVKERVIEALRLVEMEEFSRREIRTLSFGQKKRICIAGLLAMGHEILILDEPTAGLDPMGEYKLMGLLRRLNKEIGVSKNSKNFWGGSKGVTILMATHSVDMVPLFLNRLYILSRGRIIRGGSPEEVLSAPEDMENVKLRLPQIAELLWRLKNEDKLPFEKVPLTIGEARREIVKLLKRGFNEKDISYWHWNRQS